MGIKEGVVYLVTMRNDAEVLRVMDRAATVLLASANAEVQVKEDALEYIESVERVVADKTAMLSSIINSSKPNDQAMKYTLKNKAGEMMFGIGRLCLDLNKRIASKEDTARLENVVSSVSKLVFNAERYFTEKDKTINELITSLKDTDTALKASLSAIKKNNEDETPEQTAERFVMKLGVLSVEFQEIILQAHPPTPDKTTKAVNELNIMHAKIKAICSVLTKLKPANSSFLKLKEAVKNFNDFTSLTHKEVPSEPQLINSTKAINATVNETFSKIKPSSCTIS
jgi:DNA-binding transcriptional MerR regulator